MNFARVSLVAALLAFPAFANAGARLNQPAPAFEVKDSNGKVHKLADHLGKEIVVLEWMSYTCPFVRKHYDTRNMQNLQQKYTAQGVKWYSIISAAHTGEKSLTPKEVNEHNKKEDAHQTAVLLDYDGKMGMAFGATATPHMFVIGKDGKVAYLGGIDDKKTADKEDVKIAKNFVAAALDELIAGKQVSKGSGPIYGCPIHYASN